MQSLLKVGRLLYAIGIIAVGIHLIIIKDFRPEILPPFPAWAHAYGVLPILAGIILIAVGVIISGLFKIDPAIKRNVCLYAGLGFLTLIILCQLPYNFIFNFDKISRLDIWFNAGEELAYAGGAFAIAGSFDKQIINIKQENGFVVWLKKFIPWGGCFYAVIMILFGWSHFLFADFVSTMVPQWIGAPMFWTYFCGAALLAASVSIIFKIWTRIAALLLAVMLFIFFLCFHIPDAVANPTSGSGNEIVRACVDLLFCGTALVISAMAKA